MVGQVCCTVDMGQGLGPVQRHVKPMMMMLKFK